MCFYIAHFCRFHQIFQCYTVVTSQSRIKTPFRRIATGIARLDSFCCILLGISSSEFGCGLSTIWTPMLQYPPFPLHAPYLHNYIRCRYFLLQQDVKNDNSRSSDSGQTTDETFAKVGCHRGILNKSIIIT
jgi:hypothetical protein